MMLTWITIPPLSEAYLNVIPQELGVQHVEHRKTRVYLHPVNSVKTKYCSAAQQYVS